MSFMSHLAIKWKSYSVPSYSPDAAKHSLHMAHSISKMATHLDWSSTWVDEHGSLLDGCIIDCFICWVSGHPTPHLSVKCNCVNVLVSESMHSYESKIATEF